MGNLVFKEKLEGDEGLSQMDTWMKSIAGRGHTTAKS